MPSTAGILPRHWPELQASAIAADVAALNVASWGPGTERHWEAERSELVRFARLKVQTESVAGNGCPQAQPGHLADRLIALDGRYRHLQAGGWRTLSAALPGLEAFDQWKPDAPRPKGRRDAAGRWVPVPGQAIKYEAQPAHPDGGGLLLPQIPERCWRLICERQGLPFPADRSAGFWPWALATPRLQLVLTEGWKKALAAVSAGFAAVALPGVQMGRRRAADGAERLIAELQLLAPKRRWLIAFDAEARPGTARKVKAAAGALARALRAAGGRAELAELPLLPRQDKTGLDDLLAAAGLEALEQALVPALPTAVLPQLRAADRIAPAGAYLSQACPIPSPEAAPLVVVKAPMGCGKTVAAGQAIGPLKAVGVPVLMPSHRQALGQAAAAAVGVPWCPDAAADDRARTAVAGCLDSWCPSSRLAITGSSGSGGFLLADEWMQQLEHLLLSTGTTLAERRAEVLRTLAEQLARMRQIIAMDAQMADWGVALLERLSGRRALVIASEHRPMAGRPLQARSGFKTPQAAADAFRAQWAELVAQGQPFLCWCSAQREDVANSPQRLAALHRERRPGARVLVIDSTTPEAAAKLAADPDGEAQRWDAIYCSPAISSGISFQHWRPAAVIAYAGGRVAPEHVAQALARVRCPEVRAYLFAPERCPGAALRVGSGATDPEQLIAHLKAVSDPLLGQLQAADADGAWLAAWAELGAARNRQSHAYRATISGLLEAEGWELQTPGAEPCPMEGAKVAAELKAAVEAARAAADQAVIEAQLLSPEEATELARRRQLEPEERHALQRYRLAQRWALGQAAPTLELLEANRDGLAERLQLGWLLATPEAMALIPQRDAAAIDALDAAGQPFAPDRLRVALAPRVVALQALGLPQLLERFAAGGVIAADDPAVVALHTAATTHRAQLAAAAGVSPGAKATGTLRALLQAIGWELKRAGRAHGNGALKYRAERIALPAGVSAEALADAWLEALEAPITGALSAPIEKPYRGEKCSAPPPRWPIAPVVAIPWPHKGLARAPGGRLTTA